MISPFFQDNKDGLQNVQLVMMGNGEENFGPAAISWEIQLIFNLLHSDFDKSGKVWWNSETGITCKQMGPSFWSKEV